MSVLQHPRSLETRTERTPKMIEDVHAPVVAYGTQVLKHPFPEEQGLVFFRNIQALQAANGGGNGADLTSRSSRIDVVHNLRQTALHGTGSEGQALHIALAHDVLNESNGLGELPHLSQVMRMEHLVPLSRQRNHRLCFGSGIWQVELTVRMPHRCTMELARTLTGMSGPCFHNQELRIDVFRCG